MLKYFLKNPKQTGAISNCSKKVAQVISSDINLENAKNIVELGSGLGALTQEILRKKPKEAKLLAFEINPKICLKLQERFPNLHIENKSAACLLEVLQKEEIQSLEVVISALPWTCFSEGECAIILDNIYNALSVGGYFTTVIYPSPNLKLKKFKKRLFERFNNLKVSPIIWDNIPPARVYYCKKE